MSIQSDQPGPTIWLTACIHGDELGGTVTIQELFKRLRSNLLCGTVNAFPLANPFGFENVSRNISVSREDLNRAFPGDPKGSLAQRIAHMIIEKICAKKPDLVIDLHNDWRKSIPYAVVDCDKNDNPESAVNKTLDAAFATGLPVVRETDDITGTLAGSLLDRDIASLTLELGESFVINEKNILHGVESIWNILSWYGMTQQVESLQIPPYAAQIKGQILQYSQEPLSSTSGIIRFLKPQGSFVKKKQAIARIYNAFGRLQQTIYAGSDALILGQSDSSLSFPGFPIMAFGVLPPGQALK